MLVCPFTHTSFRSPIEFSPTICCHSWCSRNTSNIFSCFTMGRSLSGHDGSGTRSSTPSWYSSSPNTLSCPVERSREP